MGRRILVVEDDPGYQELLKFHLRNYQVVVCASVEDALPSAEGQPPDLIICDINLMGMTGLEFLRRASFNGLSERAPFLMCSSQDDAETRAKAASLGAAGFLPKPYDLDQLHLLVGSLLGP